MKNFRADLHVHTVLSPCADVEMIPPFIVEEALAHHIDLIAITDHNASANVAAVQEAALGTSLTVLPGMEVQSREDVHLLCLFEKLGSMQTWQSFVDHHLPNLQNQADFLGEQFIVDAQGEYIRTETRMLLTSTHLSIDEIFKEVNAIGGLVIPAHVERSTYGLFPTLGLLSPEWPVLAFEISRHTSSEKAVSTFPALSNYPLIQSGDVHRLNEFLGTTMFTLAEPTLTEIRMAFQRKAGRNVHVENITHT